MVGRLFLLAIAGCGRIGFDAGEPFEPDAWSRHVALDAVNPTTEELRDVPILVRLDPTRIDYALAAPDGRDLRFTIGAGELSHEIERWDPTGVSIVWVRLPILAASPAHTSISMLYGNSDAQALAGEAAWSADYAGVYHFAGGVRDSTANHLDATAVSTSTPVFDHLGQALALANRGPQTYPVITAFSTLDTLRTYSGWIRTSSISGPDEFEGLIVRPLEDTSDDSPYLGLNADGLFFEIVDDGGTNEGRTLEVVPVDTWFHLALVENATTVETYVDGVPRVTIDIPSGAKRPALPLIFGADCDNCALGETVANSDFLDGALDEIRLERVARSPAWIAVQVASMRDTLLLWP